LAEELCGELFQEIDSLSDTFLGSYDDSRLESHASAFETQCHHHEEMEAGIADVKNVWMMKMNSRKQSKWTPFVYVGGSREKADGSVDDMQAPSSSDELRCVYMAFSASVSGEDSFPIHTSVMSISYLGDLNYLVFCPRSVSPSGHLTASCVESRMPLKVMLHIHDEDKKESEYEEVE
jgi:hypothetical protein